MGILNRLLRTRTTDWTFDRLRESQVPDGLPHVPLKPEASYVSIFVRSMRIVDVRRGWTKFYPSVYSYVSLLHRDEGEKAEFQVVASPSKLEELDVHRVERVIRLDQRILGPVPYRGGDLTLELGLFSIKSVELAKPFLAVLEQMATVAGVSFVAAAKPFIAPLRKGVELLTDSSDLNLEVGLSKLFSRPETGYFFVIRAESGRVEVSKLRVRDNDGRLVDDTGRVLADYPYLVFSIEASEQRDDWFLIPDVAKAYKELQQAVRSGRRNDAEWALTVFKRTVLTSPDLLTRDASRLAKEVEGEVALAMPASMTSVGRAKLRELKAIRLFDNRPTARPGARGNQKIARRSIKGKRTTRHD